MTTRGQVNSNFYQIVNVNGNGDVANINTNYIQSPISNLSATGNVNLSNTSNVNLGSVSNVKIAGGTSGQFLQTDGTGNLAWATSNGGGGGNGVPGGTNTQVQFNDNGSFGGSSSFTFNKTSNILTVTNISGNGSGLTNLNGANITGSVANANYANISGTAYSVSGSNVSGQVANALVAGTVYTNAQPNITSLGTLSNLSITGNLSSGNANLGNLATANFFSGNGSLLTGIVSTGGNANYANFAGTVLTNAQPNITSLGTLTNLTVNGTSTTNTLQFNNTVTPITANIGQMFWDTGEHTVTLGMENGVQQQIGLESYIWVKASSAITDGQVVMWTGAQGDNVTAAPANVAVAGFRAGYVLGVATQNIPNNGFGYITTFGLVHGLNTNAYNVGDLLWVDPTTPGGLTATQPSAPNYQIQVATVTKKSGGDGHIQVIIRPEPKLDDLSDVALTSPSNNQALIYNSATNTWVNGVPTGLPAGSNTQVQYNNNGSLAASANFTFTSTTNTLTSNVFRSTATTGTAPFIVNSTTQVANLNVAQAAFANTAGTVTGNDQPNITGVGTLGNLNVQFYSNSFQFVSNATTGTPPFIVASNTEVANLRAQFANTANSVVTVTGSSQPFINILGNLTNITVGNSTANFTSNSGNGTLQFNSGTLVFPNPAITINQTWNNATAGFDAFNMLITNNNSTVGSRLMNLGTQLLDAFTVYGNGTGRFGSNLTVVGNVSASFYTGNGSLLTGITANVAQTVTNNAQPNITSTGTLVSLTVSGNTVLGNANITNANITTNAVINDLNLKIFEETVVSGGNTSTSITPPVSSGSIFTYTANANFTFNGLSGAVAGTSATIIISQDAVGNRIMTSTMRFANGSKTLSTTANATDIISVFFTGTTYYATLTTGYV